MRVVLRWTLHARLRKLGDQHALVLVLRVDDHVRKRRQPGADVPECHAARLSATHPQIDGGEAQSVVDHLGVYAELAIELERARVNHQGARRGARLRRLVDDAHAHAEAREGQRQHQAGGPGTDNKYIGVNHRRALR